MPLVYALVARAPDAVVLAQHAAVSGNLERVATECYKKATEGSAAPESQSPRFSVACDGYTFNYLVDGGYVFVVVADERYPREVAFACAQRIHDEWMEGYAEKGSTVMPAVLDRSFGPVLKQELEYCHAHKGEIRKMASMQSKVAEVKGIMVANVESVLQRGESSDDVRSRSEGTRDQAQRFQKTGAELRTRMWYHRCWLKVCLILTTLIIIGAITGMAICLTSSTRCFGGHFFSKGGSSIGSGSGSSGLANSPVGAGASPATPKP